MTGAAPARFSCGDRSDGRFDVDRFRRRGALQHGRGLSGRRGGNGPRHEAQRYQREHRDGDGGDGNSARPGRARRQLLQHGNPPLQMHERPGGVGRRTSLRARHAERQEQASVLARRGVERFDHGRVTRRFSRHRILARHEVRQGVKEEQPLGKRRHASEPQVGALQVRELVAERHLALPIAQAR